mmetsp:Transcript_19550/g.30711  ORF Transcript_19550/g.30711 Transcript_19550/m.30711 type:complete len:86 (-) Transcript_19550:63-320(-)
MGVSSLICWAVVSAAAMWMLPSCLFEKIQAEVPCWPTQQCKEEGDRNDILQIMIETETTDSLISSSKIEAIEGGAERRAEEGGRA